MPKGIYDNSKRKGMLDKHHSKETKELISKKSKGRKAWNRGTKGVCKSNIGSFKKGMMPWNKSKKISEKTKEKLRDARLKQIFPNKNTSIEVKLYELLDYLHLKYEKHRAIERVCQADAVIVDRKIAIFADGCFWHWCPIHYPTTTFEIPRYNRNKDANQNRILQSKGWLVLRFWEHEIEGNLADVREMLLSAVDVGVMVSGQTGRCK